MYNWQLKNWPDFNYDINRLEGDLLKYAEQVGHLTGILDTLPEQEQTQIIISTMVAEAIKTSEIEGEYLSRQDVMSSIRNNLGLSAPPEKVSDKRASGISEMMLEVRKNFAQPLTSEDLFLWHRLLMRGNRYVKAGAWRTGEEPMQVISGSIGKEKIHFEAPPSSRVPKEMEQFIKWFNDTAPAGKNFIPHAPVRSAIAHLYFESIHPFEDGNGRIGRAISEKVLYQNAGSPIVLALSKVIEKERMSYYNALKEHQRTNEITGWIEYFVSSILQAQGQAKELIQFVLKQVKFFNKYGTQLNERQLKVLQKMLDQGPEEFKGGMNAKKYISITTASKATATRDLQDLKEKGIFVVAGGGRSTSYKVNI